MLCYCPAFSIRQEKVVCLIWNSFHEFVSPWTWPESSLQQPVMHTETEVSASTPSTVSSLGQINLSSFNLPKWDNLPL